MTLSTGTMLGRYRIENVLGQGKNGVVYQGFDTAIERPVAIKVLRPPGDEPESQKNRPSVPLEEAKVVGQLNHPHIAAVYDMGTSGDVDYIVMEYVQGETLKTRLAQSQSDRATVPQILNFIVMLARALHYVHQRGILHGDIKPANIMVTPAGTPKIMDFGVARRSPTKMPSTWSLIGEELVYGTPGYIAPELLEGMAIDARADIFSLGVIAYEWLTGCDPFFGDTAEETLNSTLNKRPKPLCELGEFDSELSGEIDQALARDPEKRFGSADIMADALEVCLEHRLGHSLNRFPVSAEDQQFETSLHLNKRNMLFADFSEEDLANIMRVSRREEYREGETILREGAGGSTMYLLLRGRVSIRKTAETRDVEIKQIGAGECFGEMAILSQMPRSATAIALRSTQVIAISGVVLRSTNPVLCMKLYRNIASLLADRVRQRDEQMMGLLQNESAKQKAKRLFAFW